MNVKAGQTHHFVTMRVTKKNENFESISFNPMAFHAGKSTVDRIEVQPMFCENIRTIGMVDEPNRMLLSGFFSSENNLFWKCFPASPEGYFGLLPLMVFPMPMAEGVTYLGGSDKIAVELVFLLSYLEFQNEHYRNVEACEKVSGMMYEISKLILSIEEVAKRKMLPEARKAFELNMFEVRNRISFASVETEVRQGAPVQLDLW